MDSKTTHASLLSRVRDTGDDEAWREFEARYGELILRYARARGLKACDAEDVRQVVMTNLSKSLRGFHYAPERGRFRSYLGRCVRNAVSRFRACPKHVQVALDSSAMAAIPAEDESEAEALWEREWINHHYRLAMRAIRRTFDARSVDAFELILAGTSIRAVATTFDMTTQAVHKVKQRVRDRMHELVAEQIREEEEPDGRKR